MSDEREGPIKVHATHAYVGQTADGDVVFQLSTADGDVILQMSRPPPEGVGVPCSVDGCGAKNWPHAKICHNCLKDFGEWRRILFRVLVVLLLVLIATTDLLIVQRI